MQQQQPPPIRSVSDIYGTDEIDFLLEEIRDLEPACCHEDLQDFEIAGSRAGEIISITTPLEPLESPLETCSSWDSHLNYRERLGQNQMGWGGVVLHCDASHLKTPTGIVRILLVVRKALSLSTQQVLIFSFPFHLYYFSYIRTFVQHVQTYIYENFSSFLIAPHCFILFLLLLKQIIIIFRYHQLVAWRLNVLLEQYKLDFFYCH
jgi:hypothetical protein